MKTPTMEQLRARGRRLFTDAAAGESLFALALRVLGDGSLSRTLMSGLAELVGEAFALGYVAGNEERPYVIRDPPRVRRPL